MKCRLRVAAQKPKSDFFPLPLACQTNRHDCYCIIALNGEKAPHLSFFPLSPSAAAGQISTYVIINFTYGSAVPKRNVQIKSVTVKVLSPYLTSQSLFLHLILGRPCENYRPLLPFLTQLPRGLETVVLPMVGWIYREYHRLLPSTTERKLRVEALGCSYTVASFPSFVEPSSSSYLFGSRPNSDRPQVTCSVGQADTNDALCVCVCVCVWTDKRDRGKYIEGKMSCSFIRKSMG